MSTPKTIQIPYDTFIELLWLLKYLDTEIYSDDFRNALESVLATLQAKEKALSARDAYSNILTAPDDAQRRKAKISYLKEKYFPQ